MSILIQNFFSFSGLFQELRKMKINISIWLVLKKRVLCTDVKPIHLIIVNRSPLILPVRNISNFLFYTKFNDIRFCCHYYVSIFNCYNVEKYQVLVYCCSLLCLQHQLAVLKEIVRFRLTFSL